MPPTPCRKGEAVIIRKGKPYCRKKMNYDCSLLLYHIKDIKKLIKSTKPPPPPSKPPPPPSKSPSPTGYNAIMKELRQKVRRIN